MDKNVWVANGTTMVEEARFLPYWSLGELDNEQHCYVHRRSPGSWTLIADQELLALLPKVLVSDVMAFLADTCMMRPRPSMRSHGSWWSSVGAGIEMDGGCWFRSFKDKTVLLGLNKEQAEFWRNVETKLQVTVPFVNEYRYDVPEGMRISLELNQSWCSCFWLLRRGRALPEAISSSHFVAACPPPSTASERHILVRVGVAGARSEKLHPHKKPELMLVFVDLTLLVNRQWTWRGQLPTYVGEDL